MKAWEHERQKFTTARPPDFSEEPSDWSGIDTVRDYRRGQLSMFWSSRVPGSRAPESLYIAMIQAWFNRGYDVTAAEKLIEPALQALDQGRLGDLEALSGQILRALLKAPVDPDHPTHRFRRPTGWKDIRQAMPASSTDSSAKYPSVSHESLEPRILGGWQGQIAGGSYGTALEGYTGDTLRDAYGERMNGYIKEPETLNDDITFELALLKAAEAKGAEITADDIADMWLKYIPFGWSAEYFALENLRRGFSPPESGILGNFFSEWIGAQMRTMACGYLAPGKPMRAAEIAFMDSSVSHDANGIYGGIHSAVLSSLAFVYPSAREVLEESRNFIPDDTEFAHLFDITLESVKHHDNHVDSWVSLQDYRKTFNWIHVFPNMMAVVHGLWYCRDDIGRAFRILGDCGADVDCNAGEVGSVLGILRPVPEYWTQPFNDMLETYVPGMEMMRISELASWTASLAVRV